LRRTAEQDLVVVSHYQESLLLKEILYKNLIPHKLHSEVKDSSLNREQLDRTQILQQQERNKSHPMPRKVVALSNPSGRPKKLQIK
jgi:hypothetical protein